MVELEGKSTNSEYALLGELLWNQVSYNTQPKHLLPQIKYSEKCLLT